MRNFHKWLITNNDIHVYRSSAEKGRKTRNNKKKEELENVASCGIGACPINMMKMSFGRSMLYLWLI